MPFRKSLLLVFFDFSPPFLRFFYSIRLSSFSNSRQFVRKMLTSKVFLATALALVLACCCGVQAIDRPQTSSQISGRAGLIDELSLQDVITIHQQKISHVREDRNNRVRATGMLHHLNPRQPYPPPNQSAPTLDRLCHFPPSTPHLVGFFEHHQGLGVSDVTSELSYQTSSPDLQLGQGHCVHRYQQLYHEIPVQGGEVLIHTDPSGAISGANGVFIPISGLALLPTLSSDAAIAVAMKYWAKHEPHLIEELKGAPTSLLVIWKEGLSGEPSLTQDTLLAFHVEVSNLQQTRFFVIVDAGSGDVIVALNSLRRLGTTRIWRYTYLPATTTPFWSTGMTYPTSDLEVNNIAFSSTTINSAMKHVFGRNSYDNQGADMQGLSDALSNPSFVCPNAQWNGVYIACCPGIAVEDVIAHEWGHAYIQYSANYRYLGQSGALNEAYADIAGESTQLGFKVVTIPGQSIQPRSFSCGYGSNSRWLIGEAIGSLFGQAALRDMYNPNCLGSPRYVGDPQMECSSNDSGGVHTNSGIANQAYSILADGGTLNGVTVQGIGLEAAFSIWGRALYTYGTQVTTFSQQATNLDHACADLVGKTIKSLDPSVADVGILSSAACTSVANSILATKLRDPFCGVAFLEATASRLPAQAQVFVAWPRFGDASLSGAPIDQLSTKIYALISRLRSSSVLCRFTVLGSNETVELPGVSFDLDFAFLIGCPSPSTTEVNLQLRVEFSDNGGDSFLTILPVFTFYQPAIPTSITPTSVDANGQMLTITGEHFEAFSGCTPLPDRDYNGNIPDCPTCLYGSIEDEYPIAAEVLSSTTIRCPFPSVLRFAHLQDSYQVSVSKNGQLFWFTIPPTLIQVTGTPDPLDDPSVFGHPLPAINGCTALTISQHLLAFLFLFVQVY